MNPLIKQILRPKRSLIETQCPLARDRETTSYIMDILRSLLSFQIQLATLTLKRLHLRNLNRGILGGSPRFTSIQPYASDTSDHSI